MSCAWIAGDALAFSSEQAFRSKLLDGECRVHRRILIESLGFDVKDLSLGRFARRACFSFVRDANKTYSSLKLEYEEETRSTSLLSVLPR